MIDELPHDYCWASDWIWVIAWFQIACTALGIIACILDVIGSIRIVAVTFRRTKHYEHSDGSPFLPEEIRRMRAGGVIVLVGSAVTLLVVLLAFLMAVLLLLGSVNKDPSLIMAWIIYTIIFMGFWIVRTIVQRCCHAPSACVFRFVLLTLCSGLVFQGFSLWMAITHKNRFYACA